MLLLGLDPHVANATNRVPVLVGAATAVFAFHRSGQLDWRVGARLVPVVVAGSAAGAFAADLLPARDLGPILSAAVLIAFILLFTKVKQVIHDAQPAAEPCIDAVGLLAMLGIGFWAGFIVLDSATYLLLALILLVGCDFVRASALKSLLILAATLVAFGLFVLDGDVEWGPAAYMAAGSVAGGYAGVRLAQIATAKVWVYRLLILVLGLELMHMTITYALDIY
jgi:uncharacterized membrane protein YfcA